MDQHSDVLNFLSSNASFKQKQNLLKTVNISQARIISEIILNVSYGVIPISRHYKRRLAYFKSLWLKLAKCSDSERVKLINKNVEAIVILFKGISKILRALL
jgi:hypothetical protein